MSTNSILASAPLTSTNYILKATGTTIGNSLIWDNGTNVGIGNTNTSYTLDVSGSGRYNGNYVGHLLNVQNTNASYYSSTDYYDNAGTEKLIVGYGNASTGNALASKAIIYGTSGVGLNFYTNGSTTAKMVIDTSGNVGIGTSSFYSKFAVKLSGATAPATVANTTGFDTTYVTFGNDTISGKQLGIGVSQTNQEGSYLISVAPASEWIDLSLYARNNIFYGNGTERMRITSGGVVTVNQALSTYGAMAVKGNRDDATYGGLNVYNATGINFMSIAINTTRAVIGVDYAAGGSYMPLCFETGNTERMRITSGGNVLIGKTVSGQILTNGFEFNATDNYLNVCSSISANTAAYLSNTGTSGTRYLIQFYGTTAAVGTITYNGTNTLYNTTSDYRIKSDFEDFTGLDIIEKLKPSKFKVHNSENKMAGFIAHELQEFIPQAVSGEKDAIDDKGEPIYQSIDVSQIVPFLVKAIQEMNTKLDEQNQTIQNLQEQINILAK